MNIVLIVVGAVVGIVLLYIIGVYLYDFVARQIVNRNNREISSDEQRAEDYAAYKSKM